MLNLTDIMLNNGIQKIERTAGRFLVVMMDGRCGVGGDAGEALRKAMQPEAVNVRRAA